jgi:hypothetical protein
MPRFFSSARKKSSRSSWVGSRVRVSAAGAMRPRGAGRSRNWRRTALMPKRARVEAMKGASALVGICWEPGDQSVMLTPQRRMRWLSAVVRWPFWMRRKPWLPAGASRRKETSTGEGARIAARWSRVKGTMPDWFWAQRGRAARRGKSARASGRQGMAGVQGLGV